MTLNADIDYGEFWILFGLIAWGISTATGVAYLTPKIKRLTALVAERGEQDPQVQALLRQVLLVARVDVALLFLIVIDMTVRPFS